MPVDQWKGVEHDEDGNIIRIDWDILFKDVGMLDLLWLSPSLQVLAACGCSLFGRITFEDFSEGSPLITLGPHSDATNEALQWVYMRNLASMKDLQNVKRYLSYSKRGIVE